ncbi:hypothetical protein C8R46DRAFT_1188302 [Mycena filopes]|nr:hypothetical protein C8R46DRAFT_1188302 [Mycena filopes]
MSTFSQIHTFLTAYFGAMLSRFLALFSRGPTTTMEHDVEAAMSVDGPFSPDVECDTSDSVGLESFDISTTASDGFAFSFPEVESTPSNTDGPELLTAAVAVDLEVLPTLPSIFKFPAVRPPVHPPAKFPHRQDFGQPSGLYYDRRFPLGNVTNTLRNDMNPPMKLQTEVLPLPRKPKAKSSKHVRTRKDVNWSLPTGVPRGRRSRSKSAHRLRSPAIPMDQIVDCAPQELSTIAEDVTFVDSESILIDDAPPTPGSSEWNSSKITVFAQVHSWSDQVNVSQRHSLPPLPSPVSVAASSSPNRNSAPPVLAALSKSEHLHLDTQRFDLQDLLATLVQDATDTIAVLDDDQVKPLYAESESESGKGARTEPNLISSISASRSMAALASASSRSLADLLDSFDDLMACPRWRRVLSRSDGIARGDSVV